MKTFLALIFAAMLMATTGCAQQPVAQIQPGTEQPAPDISSLPPTATFDDKAALGVRMASFVLRTSNTLLAAKKITGAQYKVIRGVTNLSEQSIRIAESMQASDPVGASLQLVTALANLQALKDQTGATK